MNLKTTDFKRNSERKTIPRTIYHILNNTKPYHSHTIPNRLMETLLLLFIYYLFIILFSKFSILIG